jgi:hypothetical protein
MFTPASRHYFPLKQLFPLLRMEGDINADLDVEGLALDRASASADLLLSQVFPNSATDESILDWEYTYGLPPSSDAVEYRRARVAHKKALLGGLSIDYFYSVAATMGYGRVGSGSFLQILIEDGVYAPFRADVSKADIDAVYDSTNGGETSTWRVSGTWVGGNTVLQALFNDSKPPQTSIEFITI